MSSVLFTTLPAWGHAAPLCAIAAELDRRGHDVSWVAHEALADHLLPAGATLHATGGPGPEEGRPTNERPGAAFRRYFDELLVGAAERMLPAVRAAIEAERPDVVVVEQNCLAGAVGARLAGVPWVCVHVTPILLTRPWRVLPMLEGWVDQRIGQFMRAAGTEPLPWPLRSPHGTIVASSAAFLGPSADLREGDTLVGALLVRREMEVEPWGPSPRIVLSLGTLTGAMGRAFLERTARAAASLGSVLVVADAELDLPEGVCHERWAPLPGLLAHADLLVGHGGQSSVHEALVAGVPMVLAPTRYDQPVVAARVEALGAGRVVSWDRSTEEQLRAAMVAVLGDPAFRRAAASVGATLVDGAPLAADLVLGAG
ncbi:MAG: glycosyltransferase family 1 protein [Alphaproteobacteria bacterium]|nr:glycosyltransferase family 1 protein [Alphaproteobacteria bacterium]